MDNLPIQFRFEEMLDRIKTDPIIAVLALALNEVVVKQAEQDRINSLVHDTLQKHSEQINRLAESMNSLSQAMITVTAALQRTHTGHHFSALPFRGIEFK